MTDPSTDLERRLAGTFATMADETPHDPDLLGTVRAAGGRRWPSRRVVAAVAAVAAVAVVAVGVVTVRDRERDVEPASYPCGLDLSPRTLPDWAADQATVPVPYVVGDGGEILAIVVEESVERVPTQAIFVPRTGGGTIRVEGRVRDGNATLSTEATPGKGVPLDLPTAGCWDVDLTWSGGSDHLVIPVQRPSVVPTSTVTDCTSGSAAGAVGGLAWREPVDWAGVVDHVVEVTAGDLPAGTDESISAPPAPLPVTVDRVLWSRPGAEPLPDGLTLAVVPCSVGPARKRWQPNWVPGQRYVAAVLDLPADEGRPAGWAPLSPGSVFAYDDGVLDKHEGLFLDSTWQEELLGRPASALVSVLRDAERTNADLLAPLATEPDPYARSEVLRGR